MGQPEQRPLRPGEIGTCVGDGHVSLIFSKPDGAQVETRMTPEGARELGELLLRHAQEAEARAGIAARLDMQPASDETPAQATERETMKRDWAELAVDLKTQAAARVPQLELLLAALIGSPEQAKSDHRVAYRAHLVLGGLVGYIGMDVIAQEREVVRLPEDEAVPHATIMQHEAADLMALIALAKRRGLDITPPRGCEWADTDAVS